MLKSLLPLAREGLEAQEVSADLTDRYLEVIEQRIASGQNGAAWQLAHFRKHDDVFKLTADYLEHQRSGMPVHEWVV
ncbi:MAG: hypothetical protein P0Y56_01785 [Candidatus Andeanibacterium colombiense]|uniref:Uncharacterized protein n=1 Tax=Candidatus Andeanibacterium colombiense TaxID=3121345 RepID=A0AAJ5X9D7_9SPHN|nr:MAG: hypothetical protein P0Y56_01785 [Sphingomonadaceae bacterium]